MLAMLKSSLIAGLDGHAEVNWIQSRELLLL
ncbi:hypothetical protein Q31a_08210 [Aureliella helgolandensis]|uniref:Uncharacterized protein n=1 Tax=Aureliella helgolandensis TaxID=2527968 RepID=A0A518G1W6_9BACT|nr:hypothetical protein Q31a_08210 [Aureliella helgolandensis]